MKNILSKSEPKPKAEVPSQLPEAVNSAMLEDKLREVINYLQKTA